ncbi:CDP-diacylglycerol--glycerol-3-phosphate 3-phosphatidyltransferase 1, chloroplastic isoform X2 [Nymphaea colorata]|uniref:CDP-diacylglycerol--glycerol-3-phosphate 3-phosphatidyltransferase 1, chloroplastic isoform X2 n=1 Tax=Nymphaea colorata TaxID=210225 RepID=UPI00214EE4BF|nr:CDP-diacylglycerol--glycerol-3-phosphate 3-phosphatidyltransferase 1, chloroplastic isoform X2 [Nymphaea colorata]
MRTEGRARDFCGWAFLEWLSLEAYDWDRLVSWRLLSGSGGTCSSPSTFVTGRKQEQRRPHVHIVVAWCASMAISRTLKSLKALTTGSRLSSGLYHVSAAAPFSARSPFPFLLFPSDLQLRLTSAHPRLFSPFCRLIPCSAGPLFLSSPPWQLSQNATPLYLHGELVRGSGISLGLVHGRCLPTGFPIKEKQHLDNREASNADSVFNLPNLISFGRMASGPFLGWMIVNEYYSLAFLGLAMSGATDWLDGFVARRMNVNSVIGSYLDPLADKVLIGCVAVSMMKMNLLHPTLVGLVVLRDIALVCGAIYKRLCSMHWEWQGWYDFINLDANAPEKVKPTLLSKVNTVLQLTLVAAALLQPDFGSDKTEVCILGLSWAVAATTVASWAGYGILYMRSQAAPTSGMQEPFSRSKLS